MIPGIVASRPAAIIAPPLVFFGGFTTMGVRSPNPTVPLPEGIPGDLLVVFGNNASEGNGIPGIPAGWTLNNIRQFGNIDRVFVMWRIATGNDPCVLTFNANQYSGTLACRVRGFNSGAGVAGANLAGGDPPQVAVPAAPRDALCIASSVIQPTAPTGVPAGYTDMGVDGLGRNRVAYKFLADATAENPGAFSGGNACNTFIISGY